MNRDSEHEHFLIDAIRHAYAEVEEAYCLVLSDEPGAREQLAFQVLRLHSGLVRMPQRYASRLSEEFWQQFRAIRRIIAHDIVIDLDELADATRTFILPHREQVEKQLGAWYYDAAKWDLDEWQAAHSGAENQSSADTPLPPRALRDLLTQVIGHDDPLAGLSALAFLGGTPNVLAERLATLLKNSGVDVDGAIRKLTELGFSPKVVERVATLLAQWRGPRQ